VLALVGKTTTCITMSMTNNYMDLSGRTIHGSLGHWGITHPRSSLVTITSHQAGCPGYTVPVWILTSAGRRFSLSTFILTQLPAFLRALTASWWVIPAVSRPLTWKMIHGHTTLQSMCREGESGNSHSGR